MLALNVLDAGGNPVTLDVEGTLPLGVGSVLNEDYRYEATVHRLDAARFAECGSLLTEEVTAEEIGGRTWGTFDLCWYCFPRS